MPRDGVEYDPTEDAQQMRFRCYGTWRRHSWACGLPCLERLLQWERAAVRLEHMISCFEFTNQFQLSAFVSDRIC
jgi:hypothetical protein